MVDLHVISTIIIHSFIQLTLLSTRQVAGPALVVKWQTRSRRR